MKWIDTHAHTYLEKFDGDRDDVVERAQKAGLTAVIMPNIDETTIERMEDLEQHYPEFYHSSMGLHPCSVPAENWKSRLSRIEASFEKREYAAVGEIGIDLYWDKSTRNQQEKAYRIQLGWARELGIPALIHSRESLDLTIRIAGEEQNGDLVPVFHCFTGTNEQARKIGGMGGYAGLGGIMTYRNAGLREQIAGLNLERILLETDAPYLAPQPVRGKRNEPAFLVYTAETVAKYLEIPLEVLAQRTTENAFKIFNKYLVEKNLHIKNI